ncbi:TrbI/VirB10 family protein [Prosthecobacter sp. SYSU 5D2]|uniref:TrbI/VirB10 family protein n=1 Tax=Prosthecobacter sp. SYSU 5D2 TaxID=3134134 RepID=UPI0031FE5D58
MKHLQKPGVQMALLAVVLMIAAGAFFLTKQPAPPVNAPPKEDRKGNPVTTETLALDDKKVTLEENRTARIGTDQQVERFVVPAKKPPPPSLINMGGSGKKKDEAPPPYPRLVHITNTTPPEFKPSEPEFFAPRGMLFKAALVLTVDSSSLETPVLALVTEDVYWNGRLIVPAGTQVHAQASKGRVRDRMEITGTYTFVWADGREYNINCVALDHVRLSDGSYGITDGSAGIRGQIIQNDQYAELKILVAEALQGIMNNQQDQFQTVYGLVPQNNSRNAALGGGSQAASAYSGLLTKKLEADLDFVRVAAGTQFYIFTKDVFEPDLASVAGLRQGGKAASSWQLAEETYQRAQAQAASASDGAAKTAETTRQAEEQRRTAERAARVSSLVSPAAATTTSTSSSSSTTP